MQRPAGMARFIVVLLGVVALCCVARGQQPTGQVQCPRDDSVIVQCRSRDCPGYTVVERNTGYELRRYSPSKWARTTFTEASGSGLVPGSPDWLAQRNASKEAFWRLFNYFKGNNSRGLEMAMTLPVMRMVLPQPNSSLLVTMGFMIPFAQQEDTPAPTDPRVTIKTMQALNAYVRVFGGFATAANWTEEISTLKTALGDPSLYQGSFYVTAGYDAPWKKSGRRNEVLLFQKQSSVNDSLNSFLNL